jgi:copper chaperone NosL
MNRYTFTRLNLLLGVFTMVMFMACTPEPESIDFGTDVCVYCKMMISDTRYGGELVTKTAKVYKYDSVECLAAWYLTHRTSHDKIHSLWVVDFSHPKKLHMAKKAVYLNSVDLASPMGLNLSAFSSRTDAEKIKQRYPGSLLDWDDIQNVVTEHWLDNKESL